MPSGHSGQEDGDHVSTSETDSEGDNVTAASDDSATDWGGGGYEAKNGQI